MSSRIVGVPRAGGRCLVVLDGAGPGDPRAFPAAASPGHAVLSRGVGERAGAASFAARRTPRACGAYRLVVGCEPVAAVRALRRRAPAAAVARQRDRCTDIRRGSAA